MCRYLRSSAVNRPVGLGVYTKAMMNNRILTICAAIAAGMAGASLAHAQQGYPAPGQVYSTAPGPYVPGGYATDERRGPGEPDFDALDDDDAPNGQNAAALPPPGPVMSPSDPRYGRPAGAPVYSDRGAPAPTGPILSPDDPRYGRTAPAPVYSDRSAPTPTGPVLSPDDPRYGRPAGPPAVIYGDRSPGSQQQPAYSDRGDSRIPGAGIVYPNDDRAGLRPPGGGRRRTGARTRRAPAAAARRRRQAGAARRAAARRAAGSGSCAASGAPAPPGSDLPDQGARGHHRRRYVQYPSLLHTRWRPRDPLRRPRWPRRLYLERRAEDQPQGRVAGLASADRDDRAPALSAALHGRRPRQPARRSRHVSGFDRLPHPRHQPAFDDRQVRLLGLHRHAERGRLGPVRAHQGRHPRGRTARWRAAGQYRKRLGRSGAVRWPGCCRSPGTGTGSVGARSRRAAAGSRAAAARAG